MGVVCVPSLVCSAFSCKALTEKFPIVQLSCESDSTSSTVFPVTDDLPCIQCEFGRVGGALGLFLAVEMHVGSLLPRNEFIEVRGYSRKGFSS